MDFVRMNTNAHIGVSQLMDTSAKRRNRVYVLEVFETGSNGSTEGMEVETSKHVLPRMIISYDKSPGVAATMCAKAEIQYPL
jgi:hypothetical protein